MPTPSLASRLPTTASSGTAVRRTILNIGLMAGVAGAGLALTGCTSASSRSDYYTVRSFFVQPSADATTLAVVPTD